MNNQSPRNPRPLIWIARLVILALAFLLAGSIVHHGIAGMLGAVLIAAAALLLELAVSARLRHESVADTLGARLLLIDFLLSNEGDSALGQLEAGKQRELGPERQIERGDERR